MKYTLATAALLLLIQPSSATPLIHRQSNPETIPLSSSSSSSITTTTTANTIPSDPNTPYSWSANWQKSFPIHPSCNSTLRSQLSQALSETQLLAAHARDHLLRFGNASEHVRKYFGSSPASAGAVATAAGWFDRVVSADKSLVTFRCDDPDRNCATQSGWAGHWRGSNATHETVICPLSFSARRSLASVCGLGYTVARSPLNTYWAVDLLHRALHLPLITQEAVRHYADDYAGVLALAAASSQDEGDDAGSLAAFDSDALQYFAIDVWAYDIAAPGVGCTGEPEEEEEETSTASPPSPTPTASTTAGSTPATTTTSAPQECHTHDDGVIHCV